MDNPEWRKNCKNNKGLIPNLSALNLANEEKGVNFEATVVLYWGGVSHNNFVLSTELIK